MTAADNWSWSWSNNPSSKGKRKPIYSTLEKMPNIYEFLGSLNAPMNGYKLIASKDTMHILKLSVLCFVLNSK